MAIVRRGIKTNPFQRQPLQFGYPSPPFLKLPTPSPFLRRNFQETLNFIAEAKKNIYIYTHIGYMLNKVRVGR